jgi:hypothetical protein
VKLDDVKAIVTYLHSQGYRVRRLSAEGFEVAEAGPSLEMPTAEQQRQAREAAVVQARQEVEADIFAHVGGRPDWLRRQEPKTGGSPWSDNGEDA